MELNIGKLKNADGGEIRFIITINDILDKRQDQTKEVPGADARAKRYDVWSRITLKPTAEDDYADYTCEARHEALPAGQPLRTTVQLSVLCKSLSTHTMQLIT